MRRLIGTYRERPLRLAFHAWAVLALAMAMTFLLLPYAHALYHGDHPLAGFLLHRLLLAVFLLATLMAGLALVANLLAGLTGRNGSARSRAGGIAAALLLAAPVLVLAGALALLMLIGRHLGMALG